MSGETDLLAWASLALERYQVASPAVRFLRHSDNLTFQVTDGADGTRFLLRLHKPLTANFADLRQQPPAICSELLWMDALRQDAGLPLQPVVCSRDGELVSSIALPPGGEVVPCSLLGWLEAEPFRPDAPNIETLAVKLGRLMARLHNHASHWQPPEGFLRPCYGPEHVHQVLEKLSPGVQMGLIRPEDYATLRATAGQVSDIVASIPQTPNNWSMVHNDLHTGNWLFHGDEVIPIDFALCGFNYYLSDIATCAGSLGAETPSLQRLFLEGYIELRPLPDLYARQIEAFFVASVLGYYAFILPDASQHEWISSHLPNTVRSVCRKFLREEPVFFREN